jgi:type IV pilus assembly protein PilB
MQTSSNRKKGLGQILVEKNIISQRQLDAALEHQQKRKGKYLGQILFEMGVSQTKINTILDQCNKRKPLGQVLVDLKILSPQELDELLENQRKLQETMDRQPLGVLLVDLGYTTYEKYLEALSKHFNMPIVSLEDFIPHPSQQKPIGEKYAKKNRIIVLENDEIKVKIALAEPTQSLIEEVQRIFKGIQSVEFYLAYPLKVEACLKRLFDPFAVNQFR